MFPALLGEINCGVCLSSFQAKGCWGWDQACSFLATHSAELGGKGAGGGCCSTRRGLFKVCEALSLKLNWLVSFRSLGCLGVSSSSSVTFAAA